MLKVIVISGLPGSGKSTISEGIARKLVLPVFSIDPIEAAMWRRGLPKNATGIAAYEIAETLAREQLKLGMSVIIDAVNPIEVARKTWRKLAKDNSAKLILIEVICSNPQIHKQRIEARERNIEGMPEVTWERVLERKGEYESWEDERLILDTLESTDSLIEKALEYIHGFSS